MPTYKDEKKGTWYVSIRYLNWKGEHTRKLKRGFKSKKEAQEYERTFLLKESKNLDMSFKDFVDIYLKDCSHRVKLNTLNTKEYIIKMKILPYLGEKKINEIQPSDIKDWQNEMLMYRNDKGEAFSPCYLKTLHNQLSAIFNYAVKLYNLPNNPARVAGNMGKEKSKEVEFWTKEEYLKFSEAMKDKDVSYHAFEILYWCGLRFYGCKDDTRLFPISKSYLHHEMDRGCKETGVKRIRIHGLRHPYVKLTTKKFATFFENFRATA